MTTFFNTRVLITGGLGFIGSNLAIRLIHEGARVTIVDSLIPQYGGNIYNIHGFEDKLRINISDVRDPYSMKELIKNQEILFNLAGQTSHLDSMHDPYTDLDINCRAQLSILEACRENNPSIKIIFASTRQIYGKPYYLPVDEKHLVQPVDVNGINKMAGEWYHLVYHNVYNIKACSLRLTNTIGPRMRIRDDRQTFLGIWIKHILCDEPFEVWGGNQTRDFLYVDDCVDALLLAATNEHSFGKIFNVGGQEQISLEKLANLLTQLTGKGTYIIKEYPTTRKKIDIGDYYTDDTLIHATLGWKAKTPLSLALKQTIEYYQPILDHYL